MIIVSVSSSFYKYQVIYHIGINQGHTWHVPMRRLQEVVKVLFMRVQVGQEL